MLAIAVYYCTRSSVVGLSVCLLGTFANPAKMGEPIEMPFGELSRVGPRNHLLDGVKFGRIHRRREGVTGRR